jgi:eukaryotic-like serine/threonine-protein kinase
MPMNAYPDSEDYVRAVQRPDLVMRTAMLRRAVFELHPLYGIPMPASGNSAVVFKARIDGKDQALRFFIREDASSGERYAALGHHVATHSLAHCVAGTSWIDDAIEINGRTWPVIQMDWIDGRTLDSYVGHLVERHDVAALQVLATNWRDHIRRLQTAEFAHGDLQHGNILVDTSSELRLVDLDGSWIPRFHGEPAPSETGHPNYQRTGRTWGRWMDTFPGLVIYTGLLALSRQPGVWRALHNGENIVFAHNDFRPPFSTRAWQLLTAIQNPEVAHAVERLRDCCSPGWNADGSLEDLLGRQRVLVQRTPPPVYDNPDIPWWEKTAAARPGGPAMPPPPPKPVPVAGSTSRPPFVGAFPTGGWYGQAPAPRGVTGRPGAAKGFPAGPRPSGPPRPSAPGNTGAHLLAACGIALVAGLVLALLVASAGGGGGGAAFVIGAVVAFAIAMPLLARRKR